MAVEPLNHETHKDLLEQIQNHLTDQQEFQKEVLELLRQWTLLVVTPGVRTVPKTLF